MEKFSEEPGIVDLKTGSLSSDDIKRWVLAAMVSLGINVGGWLGGYHLMSSNCGARSPTEKDVAGKVEVQREGVVLEATKRYFDAKDGLGVDDVPPDRLWELQLDVFLTAEAAKDPSITQKDLVEARKIMRAMIRELKEIRDRDGIDAMNKRRTDFMGSGSDSDEYACLTKLLVGMVRDGDVVWVGNCKARAKENTIFEMALNPGEEIKVLVRGPNQFGVGHVLVARKIGDGKYITVDGGVQKVVDEKDLAGYAILGGDYWEKEVLDGFGKSGELAAMVKYKNPSFGVEVVPARTTGVKMHPRSEEVKDALAARRETVGVDDPFQFQSGIGDLPMVETDITFEEALNFASGGFERPNKPRKLKYYAVPEMGKFEFEPYSKYITEKIKVEDFMGGRVPEGLMEAYVSGWHVFIQGANIEPDHFDWIDQNDRIFSDVLVSGVSANGFNDPEVARNMQKLGKLKYFGGSDSQSGGDTRFPWFFIKNVPFQGGLDFLKEVKVPIGTLHIDGVLDLSVLRDVHVTDSLIVGHFGDAGEFLGKGRLFDVDKVPKEVVFRRGKLDLRLLRGLSFERLELTRIETNIPLSEVDVGVFVFSNIEDIKYTADIVPKSVEFKYPEIAGGNVVVFENASHLTMLEICKKYFGL